ncbi:MAG: hypothetical protein HRU28_05165 [Rhizobiales bacterium]|nr:hypothetical protein [Hyphomicrobiales bacterium]
MKKNFFKIISVGLLANVAMINGSFAAPLTKTAQLDYVPANTTVFSTILGGFPVKDYLTNLNAGLLFNTDPKDIETIMNSDRFEGDGGIRFLVSIVDSYQSSAENPIDIIKLFGLGDDVSSLFYTVDYAPVIKYSAANPDAIWNILAKAEKDSGIQGVKESLDGVEYTSYKLNFEEDIMVDLVVSTNDGWVTITLKKPDAQNSHLKIALGIEKPEKSLNQTDILQKINDKYGFDGKLIGFLNHKRILELLTEDKSHALFDLEIGRKNKELLTDSCKTELGQIVESWPRTVVGTTHTEITQNFISDQRRFIIEMNDRPTIDALMNLRGNIPSFTAGSAGQIFSLAVGLNVDKLAPSLTKIWSGIVQTKYECKPLVEMQKELGGANPAMLGMFAGMAGGVNGVNLSVFDLDFKASKKKPEITMLDALLSLSVENPTSQLIRMSMMKPILATLILADDGTEVELNKHIPELNELGGKTMMAASGKHLNIYQGEKAKAVSVALKTEEIDNNGFMRLFMDMGPLMKLIVKAEAITGKFGPTNFEILTDVDLKGGFDIDFTEYGVEITSDSKIIKK